MKLKTKYLILNSAILLFLMIGCVEPIDIELVDFENVMVVEATITDEFKNQEILLSRSYGFEQDEPAPVSNARVEIIDSAQNTYSFKEESSGKYVSESPFSVNPDTDYVLSITTSDGKNYKSNTVQLPGESQIEDVVATRENDSYGNEGMSITVDSYNPNGDSKYYKYTYEETYQIIAPYWSPKDIVITSNDVPYSYEFTYKTEEQRVCYGTQYSNNIIQTETSNLAEDRVSNFQVRFINREEPILGSRYSILVKQYIQSYDAFTYYKTLNNLSGSGNIFSQVQPGFFNGNIYSIDDPDEKILGYFDVTSVSSKRIFFDYYDFFPNEQSPPYFVECKFSTPITEGGGPLYRQIGSGEYKYYGPNPNYPDPQDMNAGPYTLVTAACGDCTELGTNVKPDFWE